MSEDGTSSTVFRVVNHDSVPAETFTRDGAYQVKVQPLISRDQGAKRSTLKLYTIEKGRHSHLDQHEYEHQVYVLDGEGILRGDRGDLPLRRGDAIFVPSNSEHQFINKHEEPFVYLLVNVF